MLEKTQSSGRTFGFGGLLGGGDALFLSTNLLKTLFKVADSIFASGYLTEGGQSLEESFRTIEAAGFTWQLESA